MKLLIDSQTSTMQVISSHTFLSMWSLIIAGIKLNRVDISGLLETRYILETKTSVNIPCFNMCQKWPQSINMPIRSVFDASCNIDWLVSHNKTYIIE